MTDAYGRSRVPGGVPTGGEFATETRTENPDLDAPKPARKRLQEALAAGAGGTHAILLRRYDKAYDNVRDYPRLYGKSHLADIDKAVDRELAMQERIDAATAKIVDPDTDSLTDMQKQLFALHGVKVTAGSTHDGVVEFRIYNPRSAQAIVIEQDEWVMGRTPDAYDMLGHVMESARDYERAGSLEGWRKMWGYDDTEDGREKSQRSYAHAENDAQELRLLLSEDYPLYVLARKP